MKDIKFGLKLWSINYDLIEKAKAVVKDGFFDYIELMVVPETKIDFFRKINVPFIIHITSERWGLNIADKEKGRKNIDIVKQCVKWAEALNAKHLIIHPGFGRNRVAEEFLKKINDERILIENMPKIGTNKEKMVGFSPQQIKKLMQNKFGFCLDLNHAIKAAISLKKDYKEYIAEFLKLNPKVLHISDGDLRNEEDKHLDIGEGEYDFNFLADYIRKSGSEYITLETPRADLNSLKEDLENLAKLKLFLSF